MLLFLVLTLSILLTIEPTHLTKSYSRISENKKNDQFDEIKWLCAFTKYTTQKFIIKPQSMSVIDSFGPFDIK